MRIEQLEYVAAVARHGSFRRAAEELHVTQPVLSETVRRLERELGVDILDRLTGTTISDGGRELLPYVQEAIDAFERLRRVAGEQHRVSRVVRLGIATAATVPLKTPTIHAFRASHPTTPVEIVTAQQDQIHRTLLEGSMDLGLAHYLSSDEMPPELDSSVLLRGRPVVCLRSDHPLAARRRISAEDLAAHPLISMRAGFAMHRCLHRLLGEREPAFAYSADGAEMGKLMVAAGLGVALLPDYGLIGDPLAERGDLVYREIVGEQPEVRLVLHRLRAGAARRPVRDLHDLFVKRARTFAHEGLATGEHQAAREAA